MQMLVLHTSSTLNMFKSVCYKKDKPMWRCVQGELLTAMPLYRVTLDIHTLHIKGTLDFLDTTFILQSAVHACPLVISAHCPHTLMSHSLKFYVCHVAHIHLIPHKKWWHQFSGTSFSVYLHLFNGWVFRQN